MTTQLLKVSQIEESRKVKVREQLNKAAVKDYADHYASAGRDALPALDIFQERGCKRWIVADGRHRLVAAKKAGLDTLSCNVHEGDEIAALDFAVACNTLHGVRRTDGDIGVILRNIFDTPELAAKYRNDEELSDKVGVTARTIQNHRAQWREETGGNRKAKQKARGRAAKHNGAPHRAPAETEKYVSVSIGEQKKNTTEHESFHVPPPAVTPEHKEVAQTVRDSLKRETKAHEEAKPQAPEQKWTAADEHGYSLLKSAWKKASAVAREKFVAEVAG